MPVDRALERALDLLEQRPQEPTTRDGYLDLLTAGPTEEPGWIQRLWLSRTGSSLYDHMVRSATSLHEHVRSLGGRALDGFLDVPGRLRLTGGEVVLDVGCGPGNITRRLARAVGDDGLVVGVDVSPAMLARAVASTTAGNVVYARADATGLPFRAACFDAVCCSACLQLLPNPFEALSEFGRVLTPGGGLAVTVPSTGQSFARPFLDRLGHAGGARFFRPDELGSALRQRGLVDVRDDYVPMVQLVNARKPG